MTTSDENDYFVFCQYRLSFKSRALFIPLKYIHNTQIEKMIEQLVNLKTSIIEECRKKSDYSEKCFELCGFNINGKMDESENTLKIITDWINLFDNDYLLDEEWYKKSLGYYINDENSFLSPASLYDKLLNMEEYQEVPITVKRCVMVTETKITLGKPIVLRFFMHNNDYISNDNNVDTIKQLLLKDDRIDRADVASNDNKFAGYGYVVLKDQKYLNEFLNKWITIDNIKFLFDMG